MKNTEEYSRIADGYLEVRMKVTPGRLSSSGKTNLIASTGGFKPIEGGASLNLTATTPLK